jgi:hypothetical protein
MTSSARDWRDPVPYSELSKRQQEIMQFLWNCPSPYSPSFREIGKAVVQSAVLTLNCHLNDSYTTPRPHIRLGLTVNFGHNLASR